MSDLVIAISQNVDLSFHRSSTFVLYVITRYYLINKKRKVHCFICTFKRVLFGIDTRVGVLDTA